MDSDQVYPGWSQVKTVLILAGLAKENHRDKIDLLRAALQKEGKTVQVVFHLPVKKPKENPQPEVYYRNSVNIYGKPKSEVFKTLTIPTDVLIDWSTLEKSPNDFIALQYVAKMKIGINRNLPCFTFTVVEDGQPTQEIINEILKYLKLINK